MAPWNGGFFERLVRSKKVMLRKVLQDCRLYFEQMQTVLFEVKAILNNRPLTYYYEGDIEECFKPNHLLCGKTFQS